MAHSFPPSLLRGGSRLPAAPPSLADAMKYSHTVLGPQPAGMHTMNILHAGLVQPEEEKAARGP